MPLVILLQLAWPGWALAAATGLGAMILGRIPGPADMEFVRWLGVLCFLMALLIVSYGAKIERTLEIVMWIQVIFVLSALIFFVTPLTVTGEAVAEAAVGSVSFGYIPKGVDILLLGGWWAYIAYASGNNFIIGGFYRDKGYGMSHLVGYIPAVIGGKKILVSPLGKTFNIKSDLNLVTWRRWMKILHYDQWFIFFLGGLLGMFIPSLIARSLLPPGTKLPPWGVAAHVSEHFAKIVGPWGFSFIAFIGFIILFTTQFQVCDVLTRNITDCSWTLSGKVRAFCKGDIRRFYYPFFIGYILVAMWAMWQVPPLILLLIGANMANFGGVFSVPMLMHLTRKLPKEIRPNGIKYALETTCLVIFWAFNIFFFIALLLAHFFGIRIL